MNGMEIIDPHHGKACSLIQIKGTILRQYNDCPNLY